MLLFLSRIRVVSLFYHLGLAKVRRGMRSFLVRFRTNQSCYLLSMRRCFRTLERQVGRTLPAL